jgi:hypothetical protein
LYYKVIDLPSIGHFESFIGPFDTLLLPVWRLCGAFLSHQFFHFAHLLLLFFRRNPGACKEAKLEPDFPAIAHKIVHNPARLAPQEKGRTSSQLFLLHLGHLSL